ncbi:class I SAM-dependent methyltransferase [Pseudonocardia sp. RS11V-5]|uniref:class I SAM-dependent methyltransferase n=1 Tax=Pseudonocardia terrae TaxID=2905831 RepID=UPI001E324F88|nr:class I SAM-dependent methyltransferase [Pseudonocardia terrae]MCE3556137.1 class I SAM-dependent methyltransferase [Pseudonocardia terrae]
MPITETRDYLPAMINPRFLPFYDGFGKLAGIGDSYWQLVAQAAIEPGATVLEIGCGTGNVLLPAKRAVPSASVIGTDPDPEALALARRKAERAGLTLQLDQAYAQSLPYADGSVDRVLSSLMLHHLPEDEKVGALQEVRRVLAPGGSLHLMDLDHDPRESGGAFAVVSGLHGLLLRLRGKRAGHGQGHAHGQGHGHGQAHEHGPSVLDLLGQAGFTEATAVSRGRTRLGTLTFYRAAA